MASGRESNGWVRLDNASNIFPSTTNRRDTKVFRLTCELQDDVNPTLLQQALDESLRSFPHYRGALRRGFFWYYLDLQEQSIPVVEEEEPVCAPLFGPEGARRLIRVVYYRRRFSVEIFHALTDGVGGMLFFRLLVFEYLLLVRPSYRELNLESPVSGSMKEKLADSYRGFSISNKWRSGRSDSIPAKKKETGPVGENSLKADLDLKGNYSCCADAPNKEEKVGQAEGAFEAVSVEPANRSDSLSSPARRTEVNLEHPVHYTRRWSEKAAAERTAKTSLGEYQVSKWSQRPNGPRAKISEETAGQRGEEGERNRTEITSIFAVDSSKEDGGASFQPLEKDPVQQDEAGVKKPRINRRAYRIPGQRTVDGRLAVIEGTFSMRQLKGLIKQYNAGVTVFLTALLIYSVGLDMQSDGSRFPIVVTVPVDLRRRFPSYTTRNFFTTVEIAYHWRSVPIFESLLDRVKEQFEEVLQPEFLRKRLERQIKYEQKLLTRLVPTPLKDRVLRLVHRLTDRGITTGLSNLGRLEVPAAMEEAIYQVSACTSVRRPQFCAMSIGDRMAITFTSPYVDTEIQRHFFSYLTRAGVEVSIASNLGRKPETSAFHTLSVSLATEMVTLSPELKPPAEPVETDGKAAAGQPAAPADQAAFQEKDAFSETDRLTEVEFSTGEADSPDRQEIDLPAEGADRVSLLVNEEEMSAARLLQESLDLDSAALQLHKDDDKTIASESAGEDLDTDDLSDLSDLTN